MKHPVNKRRFGGQAEHLACNYLENQGFRILQRNYRTRYGEIDLIAREADTLVFIEVKCRTNSDFGAPEEAVGPAKRRQILRMARQYLRDADISCRFDIVAMESDRHQPAGWRIRLIRDAFRDE